MEARLTILIFALLCLAGIRCEVSEEAKSSDSSKLVTDDPNSYLQSFAEASLKVITQGTKINGLPNVTDIHQQLDQAKTSLLSEKENATDNPDLQNELGTKIEMIEFLSRILNYSKENEHKKKLENLNGYKNFTWLSPTKMENLGFSDGMPIEDHTLEQSENGQHIVQTTIPPSSERFGETTNENITTEHDILNQSQNAQNLERSTFPPSPELLLGTTNGNMSLKNDTLEQSRSSQNLENSTLPPPTQTVFNTDSEHMKDVTEIPTNNNNFGELFVKSWLGTLFPNSKKNSSHLNTASISQLLPFSHFGRFSRRDEKQNFFYPNRNSDMKAAKVERILNIWKVLLDEIEDKPNLDKEEFLNLSSSTSVTGMEMNTTDPTSHPSEFDEFTPATLEISNVSHSVIELSTVVDNSNSTMFNASHNNNKLWKIIPPSGNVQLKMNTFDFMKDNSKRSGKSRDIEDHFLNTLENKTDLSSPLTKSNDTIFNDTKLTFSKQLPWIENIPLNFTGDSKEASSFIAFETKEFQSRSDLENNTERNAPKWNLPTQRSNVMEDEFKNAEATALISSNITLQSEPNDSSTKQSSATVDPTMLGMNYELSTDHTFMNFLTNSSNKNETSKYNNSLSVSGNELPTAIEVLKENDRQQSFLGKAVKSLENITPGINAGKVYSRFPATIISVNEELSALRDMISEYANNLQQSRSTLKDIYSRETESGQFRKYSKVSNFEDSENGNTMGFTKETQRDQYPWKNAFYFKYLKIPTAFERFENEHGSKTDDSTVNRKMKKHSGAIVNILIPLGNMEDKFLNGSSQPLQTDMKPLGIKHSNKIPSIYSFIKIEYNEYKRDKIADEIAKGNLTNFQVQNSLNNETNQLAKKKRSGGKDHW